MAQPFKRSAQLGLLASYAVCNFIVIAILGRLLDSAEFGRYSLYLSIGNLLSIVPSYGVGGVLLSLLLDSDVVRRDTAGRGLGVAFCLWFVLLGLVATMVNWRWHVDARLLGLLVLVAFGTALYSVGELYSRGRRGMRGLLMARPTTGLALFSLPLGLWLTVGITAKTALVARVAALVPGGLLLLWPAARNASVVAGECVALWKKLRGIAAFSLASLAAMGVYSLDKMLLKRYMSYAELGRYSLMFTLTFMVANRSSDLFNSTFVARSSGDGAYLDWDRVWRMRYKVAGVLFPGLWLIGSLVDVWWLRKGLPAEQWPVFAFGATMFFLSDTGWWTVSVRARMESVFAVCSVATVCCIALLLYLGVVRSSLGVAITLAVAFACAWSLAEVRHRRRDEAALCGRSDDGAV